MNERIKELLEQAGVKFVVMPKDTIYEKFAELIIQDIINVLETKNEIRHIASTSFTLSVVEGTIEKSINAITEHYGMKQHHRIKNERTVGRKVSSL
jgi:hypothetical protein